MLLLHLNGGEPASRATHGGWGMLLDTVPACFDEITLLYGTKGLLKLAPSVLRHVARGVVEARVQRVQDIGASRGAVAVPLNDASAARVVLRL